MLLSAVNVKKKVAHFGCNLRVHSFCQLVVKKPQPLTFASFLSLGREMFERRVEKSSKWVTENEDSFQNFSSVEEDYHERTISDGLKIKWPFC